MILNISYIIKKVSRSSLFIISNLRLNKMSLQEEER